jgi:flagellar motor switch protein FliG
MTYDRTERIRRAAILVASLDEALAESLLRAMPPLEATKVLEELDRIDEIEPEEQQDVLDEFRRAARQADAPASAVEFTYSAPIAAPSPTPAPAATVASATADADAVAMAEVLTLEHPQIIAAALARLDADRAAAVFAELPGDLHAEVLDRVSRLAPADEEAVLEVESQLLRKVDEQRAWRERAAAGAELARKLISKTAPAQRVVLLERLSVKKPPLSLTLPPSRHDSSTTAVDRSAWSRQATQLQAAIRDARVAEYYHDDGTAADVHNVLEDQSAALLALSDETLLAALRSVDNETGQRALAASNEKLIKRITRKLPRRQARSLRRLLRSFGPTRLADLRQAQHELLRVAEECAAAKAA